MRIAALYDIHGNLPALEAVVEELRGLAVDAVIVGGDVLPGPMPSETIAAVMAFDWPTDFLSGNGEREVLAAQRGEVNRALPKQVQEDIAWNARELSWEQRGAIEQWPASVRRGDILFCHATPRNDTELFTRLTPDATVEEMFAGCQAGMVICGHTHMQFDRTVGGVRIVNAGSVGMPFGAAGAHWLWIEDGAVHLRRTDYNLTGAGERIRKTAYPGADEFVEKHVRNPPSEAAMLAAFNR